MNERFYLKDQNNKKYEISKSGFSVGRRADNDLVLSDNNISRLHAIFHVHQGKVWVRDEGSSIGLFVNNKIVQQKVLNSGDKIGFGDLVFEFVCEESETVSLDSENNPVWHEYFKKNKNRSIWIGGGVVLVIILMMLTNHWFRKNDGVTQAELGQTRLEQTNPVQGDSRADIDITCKGLEYQQEIYPCFMKNNGDKPYPIEIIFSPMDILNINQFQIRVIDSNRDFHSEPNKKGKIVLGTLNPDEILNLDIHINCVNEEIGCVKTAFNFMFVEGMDNEADFVIIKEFTTSVEKIIFKPEPTKLVLPYIAPTDTPQPTSPKQQPTPSDGLAPNP